MTFTINIYFFYYWIFAIVFESIYIYILWQQAKKKFAEIPQIKMIKEVFKKTASLKLVYSMLFSPASFVLQFVILSFASPLLFPLSLVTLFKKVIGYKSKLEKQVDAEMKACDEAKKKSEDFMKNEGVYIE